MWESTLRQTSYICMQRKGQAIEGESLKESFTKATMALENFLSYAKAKLQVKA